MRFFMCGEFKQTYKWKLPSPKKISKITISFIFTTSKGLHGADLLTLSLLVISQKIKLNIQQVSKNVVWITMEFDLPKEEEFAKAKETKEKETTKTDDCKKRTQKAKKTKKMILPIAAIVVKESADSDVHDRDSEHDDEQEAAIDDESDETAIGEAKMEERKRKQIGRSFKRFKIHVKRDKFMDCLESFECVVTNMFSFWNCELNATQKLINEENYVSKMLNKLVSKKANA